MPAYAISPSRHYLPRGSQNGRAETVLDVPDPGGLGLRRTAAPRRVLIGIVRAFAAVKDAPIEDEILERLET
jgi:hypothetical protein